MKTEETILYDSYYSEEKEAEARRTLLKNTPMKKNGPRTKIYPIIAYSEK